ncbi:MAG: PD40 domain-containing protein [Thermoguttaceae bacterium]|nr:PD40 domain-containing protein [Thermoguttaceae bacterium]
MLRFRFNWVSFSPLLSVAALCVFAFVATAQETLVDDPALLGYWRFDEAASDANFDNSARPEFSVAPSAPAERVDGVFGSALNLSGSYVFPLPSEFVPNDLENITFSAWTRPRDLSGFREIMRKEDGEKRLLFSFQESGQVLSLGLNVNGSYEECDAKISPVDFLDGTWRFVAATFDGQTYRVYADGVEIGTLDQPGKLACGDKAQFMIGSSSGTSEFFQGSLDDLRVFSRALTADEIAALYREGRTELDKQEAAAVEYVGKFYQKKETFAKTLTASRRALLADDALRAQFNATAQSVFSRRVREDFPEETTFFAERFQTNPGDYALASSAKAREEAARMRALYTEYMPLTDEQWALLTPEENKRWTHVKEVAKRLDDALANPDSVDEDEWLELAFETAREVQERPYQREAVAPYVKPETPPVVDLTPDEARVQLEREWLFQCDDAPTLERVHFELDRAASLIDEYEEGDEFAAEKGELVRLVAEANRTNGADPEAVRALYLKVRAFKREIFMRNPVVDFDSVLYIDSPFPQGSEWRHETRHRLGYMAVPGGRLMTRKGLSPQGKQTMLAPSEPLSGSFWRPDLSYDATKVLFCFKPHNEKAFHLYEIGIDGQGLRQLTSGAFDDFDPIYLPDGESIVFSTTRGYSYVRCMPPTNAFVLARMKLDSTNLYLISRNNEPDYLPSVLSDGRVLFSRWEYTDKPLWRCVSLWTMNPDGTQTQVLWGNQTVWPDLPKDARQIPNSSRVMFTGSAHHDWFAGSIGIVDPTQGLNFPDGLTKVTADVMWPECGNGPVDPIESPFYHASGKYQAYDSPYPLSERDFLVSAWRGDKYVLLLMNVDGDRELICEGTYNVFYAQPIRERPVPPAIVDRVDWPTWEERSNPKPGVIYSSDVYEGAPEILRGKAKYLRVMNIEPKTYTLWDSRPYISTGPAVSMVQSEGVKRVLGTVPIEEDGSVSFYAPSGVALHFQLLDENQKCLQTMRSFTGVMPGERRGCVGCHESQVATSGIQTRSIASLREPSTIQPPPWDDISVSYERYVQPTLDKHCGQCHSGDGEAREVFDTTLRPGFIHFKEPYITLIGNPSWAAPPKIYRSGSRTAWAGSPEEELPEPPPGFGIADTIQVEAYTTTDPEAYATPKPMEKLSYASRLINKYCVKEHYGVELDPVEMLRMICWVDAMCPYMGTDDIHNLPDPKFQGSEWLAVTPRLETAPVVRRPGPFDPFGKEDDAYDAPSQEKIYANPAEGSGPKIKVREPGK